MIRLGVIGHGGRASSFIRNCMRPVCETDLRIVGIVDPDEKGARSRLGPEDVDVRFFSSVDELMRGAGPDAVVIGTRCNLHAPVAVECAAYDVPVFLEKPVAISYSQSADLERAYQSSRAPVLVSFPLRTSPLCVLAKSLLDDDAVGVRHHILATNYVSYGTVYWEKEYRNYEITGGLFLQKATHDFDYMMYLMDSPIISVTATAHYGGIFGGDKPADLRCSACDQRHTCPESPENRVRNGSGGSADHLCLFSEAAGTPETGTNEDTSSALVEFADGAHGVYTQVFFSRRDAARRGAVVSGYEGTVDFDWYRNDLIRTRHHRPFTDRITAAGGMSHFGGDTELARNFVALIEGRESAAADIWDGIRSVNACLAARESAKTRKHVAVRLPGKSDSRSD